MYMTVGEQSNLAETLHSEAMSLLSPPSINTKQAVDLLRQAALLGSIKSLDQLHLMMELAGRKRMLLK